MYASEMIQIASSGFSVIYLGAWPFFTLPQQVTSLHTTPAPLLEALSASNHAPFFLPCSLLSLRSRVTCRVRSNRSLLHSIHLSPVRTSC